MSPTSANRSVHDTGRWSIGTQFAALGIALALAAGLVAFLGRRPHQESIVPEQIVVGGPVKFTSNWLPPGVELELSDEASAGFARLISSGNDTFDGRFLEAAAPYGTFHVQGRSFDWHFSAFMADTRNRTRPRVWHSQVLANMFRSLSLVIDDPKPPSEKATIDDDWEPDLSGFVIQPLESQIDDQQSQIDDQQNKVRLAWEADLAGFADQP